MTKQAWLKELSLHLKALPRAERKKIMEYYNEIYGDKIENGQTEEQILKEFGSPVDCAKKILEESGIEYQEPKKAEKKTAAYIAGVVLFTLFIVIPLVSAFVGLLGGLFAVLASGFAAGIAGVAYTLVAPFYYWANGLSAGAIFAWMGMGIACIGAGILLAIGGWYALKYTAIGGWKALLYLYGGREKK